MAGPVSDGGGMFRSFRWRNYRLYSTGQLLSFSGVWMRMVAQSWLVLRLSHNSGFAVGVVAAAQSVPTLLFGASSGVIIDRFSTRSVLVGTQTTMALSSAALAVVTFTHAAAVWTVALLAVLAGFANTLDVPARQAFANELVPPADLQNAVGLNSAIVNGASLIGPAIGGVLIVTVGTGWCFVINAASSVVLIGFLALIRASELQPTPLVRRAGGQVREGLRYMRSEPGIWSNFVLTAVVGIFAFNFPVVLPVMAKLTFHGSASLYSAMTVAMGAGALVGALVVARRRSVGHADLVAWAAVLGAALCAAALAPDRAALLVLLVLAGGANIGFLGLSNTMLQLTTAPVLRGRVLAVRAVTIVGGTSVGALVVGGITQHAGARWGLAVGGLAMLPAAAWYAWFTRPRPILVIPEEAVVEAGPEAATT